MAKDKKNKSKIPGKKIGMGIAGAAAGVALGTAAAVAFANKDVRQKIGKTVSGLKDQALKTIDEFQQENEKNRNGQKKVVAAQRKTMRRKSTTPKKTKN